MRGGRRGTSLWNMGSALRQPRRAAGNQVHESDNPTIMTTTTKTTEVSTVPPRFPGEPSAVRRLPKHLVIRLVGRLGAALHGTMGNRAGNALGILMYHRTAAPVRGLPAPRYNVPPDRFREHISGLARRGFQFWPISRALAHHACGQPVPPQTLVVTFDDGYATFFDHAWPILRDLAVPATVFLSTAYLDREDPFPFDAWGLACRSRAPSETYRPLTTRQCCHLVASSGIELGAHTHTHADHRGRPSAFRHDLQRSIDTLRERFGLDKMPFAFPYGGRDAGFADDDLAEAARQTGVTCGLTTEPELVELASDPFQWGRFDVCPWDTSATLAAKLSGWYSWAPRLNKRCARCAKQLLRRASRPSGSSHSDSYVFRDSH